MYDSISYAVDFYDSTIDLTSLNPLHTDDCLDSHHSDFFMTDR